MFVVINNLTIQVKIRYYNYTNKSVIFRRIINEKTYFCGDFGLCIADNVCVLKFCGGGTFPEPEEPVELSADAYKNLPLIEIDIENDAFPTDKVNYLNCTFNMSNSDDDKENLSAKIRLRGNSTMGMPKKPFRIKFSEDQSLFGLTANKSWVLLADYIDQSCIRNYTAMSIANAIYKDETEDKKVFAPTGTHVTLVVNGNYQGVYLLCEQINENEGRTDVKIKSKNIDPSTNNVPFLVEMDHLALGEGEVGKNIIKLEGLWQPMEIKYPEYDDKKISNWDSVYNYIEEYIYAALYTLKNSGTIEVSFSETEVGFEDLVDEGSYLTYILINEIMGNSDNYWKSIYFYKTANGKMKFGPIWDFDWAASGSWTGAPYTEMTEKHARSFTLIKEGNLQGCYLLTEERYDKLVAKFNKIKPLVLNVIMNDLPDYYKVIETAAKYDANYWYGDNGAYMFESQFASVRLFVLDKLNFLETEFSKSFEEFNA